MTDPWWHDDGESWDPPDLPTLEVEDTPNPVVATIVDGDGSPLFDVLERPALPLGFHAGPRAPSRIRYRP